MEQVIQSVQSVLISIDGLFGGSSWFPAWLLGVGLLSTLALGLPQFRLFIRGFKVLFSGHGKGKGDASPFQALSAALSGTIGTGNIGGVAFALFVGGPAALFWMWVTAFLGMATKMVEVTLSHHFREFNDKGEVRGGPMYVIDKALNLKWLAAAFAVFTIFSAIGTGNMPQINNIAESALDAFSVPKWITGVVLACLLGLVIIGGIRAIVQVAQIFVPGMGLLYCTGALAVIFYNYDQILPSFGLIFEGVFSGSAAIGGFLGASIAMGFERGVQRGLFSNEAGQGSAPIAHATSDSESPVEEGMVSLIEPFIDTLVICTLTGLAILASGVWTQKFETELEESRTHWMAGELTEDNPEHLAELRAFIAGEENSIKLYDGVLSVRNGKLVNTSSEVTLFSGLSLAENYRFEKDGQPYTGELDIRDGIHPYSAANIIGEVRVHSVTLTNRAFASLFGDTGKVIVTLCLVLFAFTSAVTWYYYGFVAWNWLFKEKRVYIYQAIYIGAFMLAAVVDTSLIWTISNITIALMAIPNLIALVILMPKVRRWTKEYLNK